MDPREWKASPALWRELDGLIVWYWGALDLQEAVRERGLPVIELGLGESEYGRKHEELVRISFDRHSINELAVRHFLDLGVECVGYVGHLLRVGSRRGGRVMDLRKLVLEAGLEWAELDVGERHPVIDPSTLLHGSRWPELVAFLESLSLSTGLLAQDDYLGVMLCEAARSLGIPIPGKLAVLGQGDRTVGRMGPCPLSTIEIPGRAVGWEAAATLDAWMSGVRPTSRMLACEDVVVRESTGGRSGEVGIERAKRHFDRRAVEGVTVGELAAIAGCSSPTLRRRFREVYGIDVTREARERRVSEALRLLEESELEVREIGVRCGFSSPTNFFNFIRRQTGVGPAEYRRQHRGIR